MEVELFRKFQSEEDTVEADAEYVSVMSLNCFDLSFLNF